MRLSISLYPKLAVLCDPNPKFRLARIVEGDRLANERLEGGRNLFFLVDVDRAAQVPAETRIEETGRIFR